MRDYLSLYLKVSALVDLMTDDDEKKLTPGVRYALRALTQEFEAQQQRAYDPNPTPQRGYPEA